MNEPAPIAPNQVRTRLSLTPIMWVSIVLLVVLGLRVHLSPPRPVGRLNLVSAGHRIPIRHDQTQFRLERLGVEVTLPPGWTYLSLSDAATDRSPTFVHAKDSALVRLVPVDTIGWPEDNTHSESTTSQDAEPSPTTSSPTTSSPTTSSPTASSPTPTIDPLAIRWSSLDRVVRLRIDQGNGQQIPLAWKNRDPRRVGRFADSSIPVAAIVVTHPPGQVDQPAVQSLIESVTPIAPVRHTIPISPSSRKSTTRLQ